MIAASFLENVKEMGGLSLDRVINIMLDVLIYLKLMFGPVHNYRRNLLVHEEQNCDEERGNAGSKVKVQWKL